MNLQKSKNQSFRNLSLAALGIVYGDIGTSPLYALRESLGNLQINVPNVLGILSLIFWALILVVTVKYLCVVLRADNNGEGGILALLALLRDSESKHVIKYFLIIGIIGAGLMLGDGMLTPAISVLSAIEGINVAAPTLSQWIIPLSCGILFALFLFQSKGTEKIGFAFGPLMLIWFILLGLLGIMPIINHPIVLQAINPYYAIHFLLTGGLYGYGLLGGVFLVLTGGEALYADIGHLGKSPVRFGWFSIVLPGLLINYFGQAAYLLTHPYATTNPFYLLAPSWFEVPLIIVATVATIIASQAVISATFSLTKQAILLGLYPRLPIIQTSETSEGQIYIPQINILLLIGTVLLVIVFQNSSNLTHAYGIAVNLVMTLTTIMVAIAARKLWHWPLTLVVIFFGFFLLIDLAFLGANAEKIVTGGWIPIVLALACAFIMYTWHKGITYLHDSFYTKKEDLSTLLKQLQETTSHRLPGLTSIFVTDVYNKGGGSFVRFLELNRSLPEQILILNYEIKNIPYVTANDRFTVGHSDENICQLTLHYGFMDFISIPQSLYLANERKILPFRIQLESVMYLIEITNIIASAKKQTLWFTWQEKLFSFLMRNYSSNHNIEFYQLPHNRTIAIGAYCIL